MLLYFCELSVSYILPGVYLVIIALSQISLVNNKMKPKVQRCHHPLCLLPSANPAVLILTNKRFRNQVKEFFHGELKPETAESRSSASNQKSIKLQTHGVQIRKGSSTCPKLLSYHAITLPPHINSSISQIPSPALVLTIYCIICCKCSKMYVGQTYKTLRNCFRHHRAAAKAKRSWPLPLYRSRLQQRCMDRPT